MQLKWKENWNETQSHLLDWWNHKGLIIGHWGTGMDTGESLHGIPSVPPAETPEMRHTDIDWIVPAEEYRVSRNWQGADFMPIVFPDYGTVSLATFLGVEPRFEEDYILYHHCGLSPENNRELRFNPKNQHFKTIWDIGMAMKARSDNRYTVSYPSFSPGLDVLAELRGTTDLLTDLVLNPEWVKEKMAEINRAFFECYDRFYDALKNDDDSSVNGWFMLWGPGKVSLAQCDFCAMIGPDMFREFEIPYLREHCERLDRTLFHLDGPDALNKLDALLELESLDAVQWTPGPQQPQGGHPCWYDMYAQIKKAGKSVQASWVEPREVLPLLDDVGPEGMYVMVDFKAIEEVETVWKQTEQFR